MSDGYIASISELIVEYSQNYKDFLMLMIFGVLIVIKEIFWKYPIIKINPEPGKVAKSSIIFFLCKVPLYFIQSPLYT